MKNIFRKGLVLTPSDFNGVDWITKMSKNGLNTLGLHSGGGEAHDIITNLSVTANSDFREQIAAAGLDFEYELHAPNNLLDRALFDSHPEYFPRVLRENVRTSVGNWCVSNPDGLSIIAQSAHKLAKILPSSTNRYFFWGADFAHNSWCNCEKCANLSSSDQSLLTSNAIVKELRKDNPDATVCYLAYHSTLQAPRLVKPEAGVFAEFAPYVRNYDYAICDSHCAINRQHMQYLLELLEIFPPEQMHILEYWLDSSLFGFPEIPHRSVFNKKIAEQDIAFYASLGIRSITTFAVQQNAKYMELYGDREFLEYAEILAKY